MDISVKGSQYKLFIQTMSSENGFRGSSVYQSDLNIATGIQIPSEVGISFQVQFSSQLTKLPRFNKRKPNCLSIML